MKGKRIGIIGFGNMGAAIAERAKSSYEILIFDKDTSKTAQTKGLVVCARLEDLIGKSEAIILAVKPQDFDAILDEIKKCLSGQLVISIAAGITTKYLENRLGKARVIRVMPNMPAQVGKGVSGVFRGSWAIDEDLSLARQLLKCVGSVIDFDDESMMDAITAISGSGPAFYCYFIQHAGNVASKKAAFVQELAGAAMSLHFDAVEAQRIAKETADGTESLVKEKGWTGEELMKKVASKGGTTEAGLKVLQGGGSLADAVVAAYKRAKEMSKS